MLKCAGKSYHKYFQNPTHKKLNPAVYYGSSRGLHVFKFFGLDLIFESQPPQSQSKRCISRWTRRTRLSLHREDQPELDISRSRCSFEIYCICCTCIGNIFFLKQFVLGVVPICYLVHVLRDEKVLFSNERQKTDFNFLIGIIGDLASILNQE